MYQLIVYVPSEAAELVKAALFEAGAGRLGNYDSCCWQVDGWGQFRPLPGSEPHIGELGAVTRVAETRVELVCEDAVVEQVVRALKAAHPYETPAYSLWRLHSENP